MMHREGGKCWAPLPAAGNGLARTCLDLPGLTTHDTTKNYRSSRSVMSSESRQVQTSPCESVKTEAGGSRLLTASRDLHLQRRVQRDGDVAALGDAALVV